MSDYFNNFTEVSLLHTISTQTVVREFKTIFARFDIPEILVTDNGPQFTSKDFEACEAFAESWSFNYHPAKISSLEWPRMLPTSESLLRPSYSLRDDVRAISYKKRRLKK